MSTTDGQPSVPLVMVANHSVNIILLLLKLKFVSMLSLLLPKYCKLEKITVVMGMQE